MFYEIEYMINGEKYSFIERPTKGWEPVFFQQVLHRIESLVMAGAVVTDVHATNC